MQVPENIRRWVEEADRLGAASRFEAAISLYKKVLGERPDLADSWFNLAVLLRKARHFDAALASYQEALARGVRGPEEAHLNRAVILTDYLRNDAAAERELRKALALNSIYVPALQNLANLYTDLGRREEAAELYERILELDPGAFEALARYAQLRIFADAADPMIARLEEALRNQSASAAARASLGFALARGLDRLGEHRRAFAAAEAANREVRASVVPPIRYDRRAQEALVDELIGAFAHPLPAVTDAPGAREATPQPIFICGMFRSGSTLAEHLLAGDAAVASGGEMDVLSSLVRSRLSPFPAALRSTTAERLAAISREYQSQLARVFPAARWVTDKRMENFYYVGLIRSLFPHARIVHTTRDALDTCLSIYFLHLDPAIGYASDLQDIGHYYRQYRRLMRHWQELYGDGIFELNYDALVRDPAPTVQALFKYCGLSWSDELLDAAGRTGSIKTASVWQVREPLYRRSSGRAAAYTEELAALKAQLASEV